MTKKKKKLILLAALVVILLGFAFFMNNQNGGGESSTMRELGYETVVIVDEFLNGTLPVMDAQAYIAHMLEALDCHVLSRQDPLSMRESDIRAAISWLHTDVATPNRAQIITSRNRLAQLVGVPDRTN